MKAFHPSTDTVFIEFSGSSLDTSLSGCGDVLRILYRTPGGLAHAKAGIGSQSASTDDVPFVGDSDGIVDYLGIDFKDDHVAIIAPNGSNAFVTRGYLR